MYGYTLLSVLHSKCLARGFERISFVSQRESQRAQI